MVSLGDNGFDSQAKENNTNRCLPKGEYRAALVNSERKTTKDGKGAYLRLDFQILDGEYQNQHVFTNCNLWLDPSKTTAITIARGQFSELCRAVNVLTPKDTAELHNKPVIIRVKVDESEEYGDDNDIVGYKPASVRPVSPVVNAVLNTPAGQQVQSAAPSAPGPESANW